MKKSIRNLVRSMRRPNITGKNTRSAIAMIVVFTTVYTLIMPAIALERNEASNMAGVDLAVQGSMHGNGQSTREYACSLDVHKHTDSCYAEIPVYDEDGNQTGTKRELICGKVDWVVHTHDENCYIDGKLVCDLPEHAEHVHTDACYSTKKVLTCGMEEGEDHTHTDECYTEERVLTCGESALHTHTVDCYENGPDGESPVDMGWVTIETGEDGNQVINGDPNHLVCGQLELRAHQHTDACFVDVENPDADQDTEEDEADTTAERDSKNDTAADKETGTGEGIDSETDTKTGTDADSITTEKSISAEPVTEAGDADHLKDIEIVTEKAAETDVDKQSDDVVGAAEERTVEVEGSDYSIRVSYTEDSGIPSDAEFRATALTEKRDDFDAYRERALAAVDQYTELENSWAKEMPGLFDLTIYDADGEEIQPKSPISVSVDLGKEIADDVSGVYAVHFPGTGIDTVMSAVAKNPLNRAAQVVSEKLTGSSAEVIETTEKNGEVQFEAESLSVYAIVYTVDFHYAVNGKMYDFSIPGGGFVSLQHLVEVLGVEVDTANSGNASTVADNSGDFSAADDEYSVGEVPGVESEITSGESADSDSVGEETGVENGGASKGGADTTYEQAINLNNVSVSDKTREFVADIASVEFSNSSLVWTGKVDETSTIGGIKNANGLEVEYSADLTDAQIAEINSSTVEAGDWALISLQPFDTEESLTVTMTNGDQWTVKVTDAQISTHVITADGEDYLITVTYGPEAEIPNGSKLSAVEILEGSGDYEKYYDKTLQILEEQNTEENFIPGLSFARFFDITIYNSEGIKIEPKAPVEVKIIYEDSFEVTDDADLKVVHFAEAGTEVIDIDNEDKAVSEIVYEQNGFSVIGTVTVTDAYGWPAGSESPYVIILQSGSSYYAVAHDGTLREVHYLNGTVSFMGEGTTTLDYLDKYLWDYTAVSSTRHTARLSTNGEETTTYIDPIYGILNESEAVIGTSQRALYISEGKIYTNYYGTRYSLSAAGGTLHRVTLDEADASPIFFAPLSSFTANSSESEDYDFIDINTLIEEWKKKMTQDLVVDKTAEVFDYENRIYQVDLMASSGYHLITPALALEFVVDASRSMYFPENLYAQHTYSNTTELSNWIQAQDHDNVYYLISDQNNTATNWAVFYHDASKYPAVGKASGWYYTDASYYFCPDDPIPHPEAGHAQTGQHARYPDYGNYIYALNANSHPGSLNGTIYTSDERVDGQPWSRLDYMKLAVEAASRVLFAVDPTAQIGLVSFNKNVNSYGPYTATGIETYAEGDQEALINALNNIGLSGGTNHTAGLNKAVNEFEEEFNEITKCQTTVVLITDGAPNGTTWAEIKTAATHVKDMTNAYGQNTRLFTLGLSLENIGSNKEQLAAIATDESHSFNAEKSTEVVDCITKIIEGLVIDANLKGNVTDVIDPAFYPVNSATGMPLESGTWITKDGTVTTEGAENAVGQVINENGIWKVLWGEQLIEWPAYTDDTKTEIRNHGWNGRVYIKAQEDFLGGNDINTNASGSKAEAYEYINPGTNEVVEISDDDAQKEVEFSTPYVNVDELLLDENSTEWTVYLGESVDPKTELQNLINEINVYEVVKDDGTLVYTLTAGSTANPTEKKDTGTTFKLSTLVGTLTDEDWTSLISGTTKEIVYTKYGHTPGYITISLTQDVKSGEDDLTLSPHNTAVVGEDVEKYTLTVKYEPVAASIADYHTGTNLTSSHGADTDNSESDNIHIINVFGKGMQITKTDESYTNGLKGSKFVLYRTAREGDDTSNVTTITGVSGNYYPAAELDLSDDTSGVIDSIEKLADGETYYLVETKAPDGYIPLNYAVPVTLTITNSFVPKPGTDSQSTKPTSGIYDWTQTAALTVDTSGGVKRTDADNTTDLTHTAVIPDSENTILYFRIANSTGYELPNTGGPGTRLFTILGSILILGAGVLLWRRRRLI